jgi:Uri superfamily endonuclease
MIGAYVLLISLPSEFDVKIGSLGKLRMRKGTYCYVGSAKGKEGSRMVENRTGRHRRLAREKEGNLRWHIDYILTHHKSKLENVFFMENKDECIISKALQDAADSTVGGFGSSDCKKGCAGHLHYFKDRKQARMILTRLACSM